MKYLALTLIALFAGSANVVTQAAEPARLSGTTITTTKLEATVSFFVELLGFREVGRRQLDAPASLSVFGIGTEESVRYVSLVPGDWSRDRPYQFSGVNLVELVRDAESADPEPMREPRAGEITLAYSVSGLTAIRRRVLERGDPIVTPFAQSGTGRSMTLTVLDPNGIRVHLYEFLEQEK